MPQISRRTFIAAGSLGLAAGKMPVARSDDAVGAIAEDEAHWAQIAHFYDQPDGFRNVENGYWGVMARPVLDAYLTHTVRVNRDSSYFARRSYAPFYRKARADMAARLGVDTTEITFTRGATEALQNIIGGFNGLAPGDTMIMSDSDYGSVQESMRAVAKRKACDLVTLTLPEAADHETLIETYRKALDAHPKTRLLLLTHISHRTGLLLPVKAIVDLAHSRGVRVVLDSAHAWGQVTFKIPDVGADFIGFNLHKWIGAPLGVGAIYIRGDRLSEIDPNISASEGQMNRIEGRVHTGTSNFAAIMTVPDAFAFHDRIGGGAKEARVRYLRDHWVKMCRTHSRIEILTNDDPRLHAGITSFRFTGMTTGQQAINLVEHMLERSKLFTVHRTGLSGGACVRVTPSLYNSTDDMTHAADAILEAAETFEL